jgi:transcriptional regulator with XRE-family HTH domain
MTNYPLKLRILERFGSQTNFSKRVSQSESTISRVLRGHRNLSAEERERWSQTLGCPSDHLFRNAAKEDGLSDPQTAK